jgi:hypothetical protein
MLNIHDAALARYMTPYKYGRPVLEGSGIKGRFDSNAVDIPFVFLHRGRFFMLYTGFDGIGYQSAFAVSDDLLRWEFYGMALPRLSPPDDKRWDALSASASWILRDNDFFGGAGLKKHDGKYWMVYSSYPGTGYENGPAEISLAWTEREDLSGWKSRYIPGGMAPIGRKEDCIKPALWRQKADSIFFITQKIPKSPGLNRPEWPFLKICCIGNGTKGIPFFGWFPVPGSSVFFPNLASAAMVILG